MRLLRAVMLALVCCTGPVAGQEVAQADRLTLGQVRTPVLVVDLNRLFVESLFGKRVTARLNEAKAALRRENDRIMSALTEEERSLTERRATMPAAEFGAMAEEFDARVQAIRTEQDAKNGSLNQRLTEEQDLFIRVSRPILDELMRRAGAVVILDRRFVLARVDAVDVTEEAIAEIDARIGDGAALLAPAEAAPEPAPGEPVPSP